MNVKSITEIKEIINSFNETKKNIQKQATIRESFIIKSVFSTIVGSSCILGFINLGAAIFILVAGLMFFMFGALLAAGNTFVEDSIKKKVKFENYENSIYEVLEQEKSQKSILTYITDSYNQKNPYIKLENINELKIYLINKNYNNALLLISNMFYAIEDYQEEQKLINSYDEKLGLPILEQEIELEGNVKWAKLL